MTVEEKAKQVDEERDVRRGHVRGEHLAILLERDWDVAKRTPRCFGHLRGGLRKRQSAWPSELVRHAPMPILGEGGDGDVGDVVAVHEGLRHVSSWKEHLIMTMITIGIFSDPSILQNIRMSSNY